MTCDPRRSSPARFSRCRLQTSARVLLRDALEPAPTLPPTPRRRRRQRHARPRSEQRVLSGAAADAGRGLRQPDRGHARRERRRGARQRRCDPELPDLPPEEEAAHLPRPPSKPIRPAQHAQRLGRRHALARGGEPVSRRPGRPRLHRPPDRRRRDRDQFGGGGFGQPLPSGVDNVRASIASAAARRARPPARSASSRARSRACAASSTRSRPSAATTATRPRTSARAAPASALTLGRAISLRRFRGDGARLPAASQCRAPTLVVGHDGAARGGEARGHPPTDDEGEQLRARLQRYLVASAAPGTPVIVGPADRRSEPTLKVDIAVDPTRDPARSSRPR